MEGKAFRRWAPLLGSLYMIVICLGPAVVVSAAGYLVGSRTLGRIENPAPAVLLLLPLLGCSILLFLDRRWPRRLRETSRQKICALAESRGFLDDTLSTESASIIDGVLETLRIQHHKSGGFGVATTHKMFELTMLASLSERSGRWIGEHTRQWALDCEINGGFGVWPGSGPRLSSTYQCLRILQQTGGIPKLDGSRHVSWIRSLQSSDGSFRGPWNYRPRWEDTFFATMSLNLLGSSLEEPEREHCLTWLKETLVRAGIERGQLDAFHHCLAAVDALGGFDATVTMTAGKWLAAEFDRLLLTHVGHNAENVHHVVCAYDILKHEDISAVHPERITLLANRIRDALEAEFAALHIR